MLFLASSFRRREWVRWKKSNEAKLQGHLAPLCREQSACPFSGYCGAICYTPFAFNLFAEDVPFCPRYAISTRMEFSLARVNNQSEAAVYLSGCAVLVNAAL